MSTGCIWCGGLHGSLTCEYAPQEEQPTAPAAPPQPCEHRRCEANSTGKWCLDCEEEWPWFKGTFVINADAPAPPQPPLDAKVARLVTAATKAASELEADWYAVTIYDVVNEQLNEIGRELRAALAALEEK
jgi:hypothetical protein